MPDSNDKPTPATLIFAEDYDDVDTYEYVEYSSFSRMLIATLTLLPDNVYSDTVQTFIDGNTHEELYTASGKYLLWYDSDSVEARRFYENEGR